MAVHHSPGCVTMGTDPLCSVSMETDSVTKETGSKGPVTTGDAPLSSASGKDLLYLPRGLIAANETNNDEFQNFDALMLNFMKEHQIPGVSLVISKKGKILYTQSYGYATHGELLRPHHLFRIASISKVVTAVAVLRLYEQGRLKLADRVFGPKGILSEFSPTASGDRRVLKITVKHLLQHSAGWDREVVGDPVFWKHVGLEMGVPEPVSNYVLLKYMMNQKLQFTPGTKYVYSNLGYVVLGRVIERISGVAYEAFCKKILGEVDITEMRLGKTFRKDAHQNEVEYFASPKYRSVDSIFPDVGKVAAPYGAYSMEMGEADGGWVACPTDLVKFFHNLEGIGPVRLLKADSFKLMLERPSYARGSCWYGLGLDVSWYRKAWEHGGHVDGATGCLTHSKEGFTWAVLCNYWPTDSDYTSLVSYGLAGIPSLNRVRRVQVHLADLSNKDKSLLVNIQLHMDQFEKLRTIFFREGYRILWFDGYQIDGRTFCNVIWRQNELSKDFVYNLSTDKLTELTTKWKTSGHRPVHIDPYACGDEIKFAVIFSHEPGLWTVACQLLLSEVDTKLQTLKQQGYCVVKCLAPYFIQGQGYACLLAAPDETSACWPKYDLSVSQYEGEFKKQTRYGHLPSYIKSYTWCGEVSLSVVWIQPGAFLFTAEHDMSRYRALNDIEVLAPKSFVPLCVCGYEGEEGGHKFAVVCVKKAESRKRTSIKQIKQSIKQSQLTETPGEQLGHQSETPGEQ